MTESTSDKQNELWQDCAAGSLSEFSAQARARRLRGRLSWAAGMAAAACILVAAIAYSPFSPLGSVNPSAGESNFQAPAYPRYGGLSCPDVLHRLDAYFAKELTPDQRGQIQQHLPGTIPASSRWQGCLAAHCLAAQRAGTALQSSSALLAKLLCGLQVVRVLRRPSTRTSGSRL